MKLPRPQLDDRTAFEMISQAKQRIRDLGGDWQDLSPSDPGVTLLELFAYLTEQLQYRLNRVPELHYVALLDLIGVRIAPPTAAMVELQLRREEPGVGGAGAIPRGSVFATEGRGGPAVEFTTASDLVLAADEASWTVRAYNARLHPPEVVGHGTGLPGHSVGLPAARVPVVAPLRDLPSFRLWVEEPGAPEGALLFDGGNFVRWREVESFADTAPTDPVFRLDRVRGVVEFAPAVQRLVVDSKETRLHFAEGEEDGLSIEALPTAPGEAPRAAIRLSGGARRFSSAAEVDLGDGVEVTEVSVEAGGTALQITLRLDPAVTPGWRDVVVRKGGEVWTLGAGLRVLPPDLESHPLPRGRVPGEGMRVLVESWSGGGARGNVGPNSIARGPLPGGLQVINPRPATGGRDVETLANAMERGPQELKELRRVVTSEDYEALVLRTSGSVSRASATAKRDRWVHAAPGTVEVTLVPAVPLEARGPHGHVRRTDLESRADGGGGADLERERILRSIESRKPLGTRTEVSWCRYKDVQVRARLRVHPGVDPKQVQDEVMRTLHDAISPLDWPFERPLLLSDVYELILRNPSVNYVASASMRVDLDVGEVFAIQPDRHQPHTFFAAAEGGIFRSLNDGRTWEGSHPTGAKVEGRGIVSSRINAGQVFAILEVTGEQGRKASKIIESRDCGETWHPLTSEEPWQLHDLELLERRTDDQLLLLATSKGLREVRVGPGANAEVVEFTSRGQRIGADEAIRALATGRSPRGEDVLYLAFDDRILMTRGGLFDRNFITLPPIGHDLRPLCLLVEERKVGGDSAPRLWAGLDSAGTRGRGVAFGDINPDGSVTAWTLVDEVRESREDVQSKPWDAGTAYAVLQRGDTIFVATHQGGVGRVIGEGQTTALQLPSPSGGLPVRGLEGRLFEPVQALCGLGAEGVLAGVKMGADSPSRANLGVYVSPDGSVAWEQRSGAIVETIDMPAGYLPVSMAHELIIDTETGREGAR